MLFFNKRSSNACSVTTSFRSTGFTTQILRVIRVCFTHGFTCQTLLTYLQEFLRPAAILALSNSFLAARLSDRVFSRINLTWLTTDILHRTVCRINMSPRGRSYSSHLVAEGETKKPPWAFTIFDPIGADGNQQRL